VLRTSNKHPIQYWVPNAKYSLHSVVSGLRLDQGRSDRALILIGDADEWTKAEVCRRFAERIAAEDQAGQLVLRIYPGATHAFDAQGSMRTYAGHPIKPDPVATADAWNQVVEFLHQHIGP